MIVGTNRWREAPDPALSARIRQEGVMLDTAEVYGRGRAESVIGAHLPSAPVMTKIMPWLWRSPRHFGRHLGHSLARLRRTSVSVLVLHFPARRAQHRWLGQLAGAVHAGQAEAVGLSNHSPDQLHEAMRRLEAEGVPLHAIQAEISLLKPAHLWDGLRETCRDRGIRLMAFRILGAGALLQPGDGPVHRALARACQEASASPVQVSLAWLRHHGVEPIVGLRSAAHLTDALRARSLQLSEAVIAQLDRASR